MVSFTKFWSANQSVAKDEPVVSIVPLETGNFVGRINLKMQRSGKGKDRSDWLISSSADILILNTEW